MIETIRQGLKAEGIHVPISKLCQWFGVPRRTVYYLPTKTAPTMDARLADAIKAIIEENPAFGYRTVAHLLGFNKNTVQRIFQLHGWQVKKRPVGSGRSTAVGGAGTTHQASTSAASLSGFSQSCTR
jgi:putative transposase